MEASIGGAGLSSRCPLARRGAPVGLNQAYLLPPTCRASAAAQSLPSGLLYHGLVSIGSHNVLWGISVAGILTGVVTGQGSLTFVVGAALVGKTTEFRIGCRTRHTHTIPRLKMGASAGAMIQALDTKTLNTGTVAGDWIETPLALSTRRAT